MEGSRTDLAKWFIAFYLISCPNSISALQLSKKIDVTYKTAWLILQKIRHAISVEDAACPLVGSVYVNLAQYSPRPRSIEETKKGHPLYVGAAMNENHEPIYVKMKLVAEEFLYKGPVFKGIRKMGKKAFIEEHIEPNPAQLDFRDLFSFKHKSIYRLFRETRFWMMKTFHGLCGRHLQGYFNEYCYRINASLKRQSVFENLVGLCATSRKITYADIAHRWSPVILWGY